MPPSQGKVSWCYKSSHETNGKTSCTLKKKKQASQYQTSYYPFLDSPCFSLSISNNPTARAGIAGGPGAQLDIHFVLPLLLSVGRASKPWSSPVLQQQELPEAHGVSEAAWGDEGPGKANSTSVQIFGKPEVLQLIKCGCCQGSTGFGF